VADPTREEKVLGAAPPPGRRPVTPRGIKEVAFSPRGSGPSNRSESIQ